MAIIDLFDRGWACNPDGVAYIAGDRSYGFDEIGRLSCRIANALLAANLPKETKGAVLAGNDPVSWTCVLGLWRAGLAWVPVNRAQQRRGERLAARRLRLRGPVLPGGLRADDRRAARRAPGHQALGLRRGRGRRVPIARGVHRGPPRHAARRRPRARRRRGGHADRWDDGQAQGRDEHAPQLPDVRRQLHDHLRLPRRRADRQPRGRAR